MRTWESSDGAFAFSAWGESAGNTGAESFGVVSVLLSAASGVEATSGNVEDVFSCAVTDPLTVASDIIKKRLIAEVVFTVVSDTVSTEQERLRKYTPGEAGVALCLIMGGFGEGPYPRRFTWRAGALMSFP